MTRSVSDTSDTSPAEEPRRASRSSGDEARGFHGRASAGEEGPRPPSVQHYYVAPGLKQRGQPCLTRRQQVALALLARGFMSTRTAASMPSLERRELVRGTGRGRGRTYELTERGLEAARKAAETIRAETIRAGAPVRALGEVQGSAGSNRVTPSGVGIAGSGADHKNAGAGRTMSLFLHLPKQP